jgi:predicted Zn-dependent protease
METTKQVEDWAAGKAELKDVIGLDAESLARLRGRAQWFVDGGHHERALIMLEMLEELDRNDVNATLLAIDMLLELGRSDAAERKIEALLARAPDDPAALVAKAELLIRGGKLVPAARLLEAVVARDPQAEPARRALAVAARAHARLASR